MENQRVDLTRALQGDEKLLGVPDRLFPVAYAHYDGRELVTPQPGQEPARPHCLRQSRRDQLEHPVAQLMAERVVDRLEVIKIDNHYRYACVVALSRLQRTGDMLNQPPAIR